MAAGMLQVCATPIGNLEDVTLRLLRVLREADLIAAEDTRTTRKLLSRYEITTPLVSYHAHSDERRLAELLARLEQGGRIALVSEAGTPGISDPGLPLVEAALSAGVHVEAVPGPSAVVTALSIAGLPTGRFAFEGFLPLRGADRRRRLAELASERRTMVIYEAPHRLLATLADLEAALGDRPAAVARELTKRFEEVYRGTLAEAREHFSSGERRGEFTLVVQGMGPSAAEAGEATTGDPAAVASTSLGEAALELVEQEGIPLKVAAQRVAAERGCSRNAVYREALARRERGV